MLPVLQVHFQHIAQGFRLGAVHQQLQALAGKRLLFPVRQPFQAQQSLLTRLDAPVHHLANAILETDIRWQEHPPGLGACPFEHRPGGLEDRGCQGSADHDHRCGAVEQRPQGAALEQVAAKNGRECQDDAQQAEDIH